jgi:hypothetical protein
LLAHIGDIAESLLGLRSGASGVHAGGEKFFIASLEVKAELVVEVAL